MSDGGNSADAGERRSMIYCLVPADLAASLHEPLREHFREDPGVEVVVERRRAERRSIGERRERDAGSEAGEEGRAAPKAPPRERRRIRSRTGRRIGERRAALERLESPLPLPRRARRCADRLVFVERLEPSTQQAEDLDTARLVTRFQAGEREAFSALYTRYYDRVYGYLRVALRDPHEAEDATQQVFTQVLEGLPRYERRRQPFRAWLFIVVRNLAVRQLQVRGRTEAVDPQEVDRRRERLEPAGLELPTLDWISDRDLLLFVERLPVAQRQVLVLRFMLGLTTSEAGEILSRTPNEVAVLQYRALEYLRDRLAAVGRGPQRRQQRGMSSWPKQAHVLRRRRFALVR